MNEFPIDSVRAQFPALGQARDGVARVFMDNPAGTQLPQRVIEAVSDAFLNAASNYGGFFENSVGAGEVYDRAHSGMATLLNAPSEHEIVVAQSMTNVTLHMSRALARTFEPGDEIIVTKMDHEGDVSPWLLIAEDRGLTVRWLPFNLDSWTIEPDALDALLNDRTRLLALNYASNLTGSINDVAPLVSMARQAGALTYVDAVQFAPHGCVDVRALDCDFLVCSSYKFFGPHLGVLWGRRELLDELAAYKVRCATNESPGKWETGTPQTELLAGLAAAVDYYAWLGAEVGATGDRRACIEAAYVASIEHETALVTQLISGLQSMKGVQIHGITNPNRYGERVPTVSITHDRVLPMQAAEGLAADEVCVWAGHNYAYEVVKHIGIDEHTGVIRIGMAHYNTAEEVERTLRALERVFAEG